MQILCPEILTSLNRKFLIIVFIRTVGFYSTISWTVNYELPDLYHINQLIWNIILRHPFLCLQQALNEPPNTSPAELARLEINDESRTSNDVIIEWCNKPAYCNPCYMTIEGFQQVTSKITLYDVFFTVTFERLSL